MSTERWKKVKDLYARAAELPEAERRRFLADEVGEDEALISEVLELLSATTAESGFLRPPEEVKRRPVSMPIRTRLGDFELLEVIGRGGMGIVYRARQISLDRDVAVKVLPRHSAMEQRHIDRFKREAHAAARLDHPAIVPIHFVGEDEGTYYFAMQYVEGHSLHEELELLEAKKGGKQAPILAPFDSRDFIPTVARLTEAAARALHFAHEHGVVHRDVKPQNLLLDRSGSIHVVDFGLAKVAELGSISRSGELAGTYHYMSPEQAMAKRVPVDQRTDIFSLGVVLYEMLTLHRPFDGTTSHEVLYRISFAEPRPIRRANPRVPRDLETICQKALAKKPDDRYRTAGELADDLRRFLGHEAILAKRPSPVTRFVRHVSRRRSWYVPAAAAVGAMTVGVFAFGFWSARRDLQAMVRPLKEVVEAEDLGAWPIERLLQRLRRARALEEGGTDEAAVAPWVARVIRDIEAVGRERFRVGRELLQRGLPPPEHTPLVEYRPASDADYFAALQVLQEARLLLPDDTEVARWADPRSTYPQVAITADSWMDGAEIYLQTVDWWSSRLGPKRSIGVLPIEGTPVEPGVYRITVVLEDSEGTHYCELTRVLSLRGRTHRVELPVIQPTDEVVAGMVLIPAGRYRVSAPYKAPRWSGESTELTVELPEFWIDRTEVTNAQYRIFVEATDYPAPGYWGAGYRAEWDDLPVIGIEFEGARAYAEWAGKRLPTVHEWEVAARGPEALPYPWGTTPPDVAGDRAVMGRAGTGRSNWEATRPGALWDSYLAGVRPVGSTTGDVGPFSLVDTLGNVSEWTETVFFKVDAAGDPHPAPGWRLVKGNQWDTTETDRTLGGLYECTERGPLNVGFRCAKSVWVP